MRREELEQRLAMIERQCETHTLTRSYVAGLRADVQAAIAERAMPVTPEWLETIKDMLERAQLYPVMCNAGCLMAIGTRLVVVTTMGQLLDLLSGLGVRK